MASNYVDYRGCYLRINDSQMVAIFVLMVEAGRKSCADKDEIIHELEGWHSEFANWVGGSSNIDLEDFWPTDEGQQTLLQLLAGAETLLREFGKDVPASFLNRIVYGNYSKDVPADYFLPAIEKIREFLLEPQAFGTPIPPKTRPSTANLIELLTVENSFDIRRRRVEVADFPTPSDWPDRMENVVVQAQDGQLYEVLAHVHLSDFRLIDPNVARAKRWRVVVTLTGGKKDKLSAGSKIFVSPALSAALLRLKKA